MAPPVLVTRILRRRSDDESNAPDGPHPRLKILTTELVGIRPVNDHRQGRQVTVAKRLADQLSVASFPRGVIGVPWRKQAPRFTLAPPDSWNKVLRQRPKQGARLPREVYRKPVVANGREWH